MKLLRARWRATVTTATVESKGVEKDDVEEEVEEMRQLRDTT